MPFIELQQRLYPLREGENRVGAGIDCDVRIPDLLPGEQLAITIEKPGSFIWTLGSYGRAEINGRPLSEDPIPLFPGDQIALNGNTMVYLDDRGLTYPPPAKSAKADQRDVGEELEMVSVGPEEKSERVGVLCRLDDGKKFVIDQGGFTIGREKRCDIVIADPAVSRLNTEISFADGRYVLSDLGRTGTRVNGREIRGSHELQVGDVIQIGEYEFSFMQRPASAADIAPPDDVTPIRSDVPEAATIEVSRRSEGAESQSGNRAFFWLLILVASGAAAALLLV